MVLKSTIYQFEPRSTIDARGVRYTPPCIIFTSGHIEIISSLQTNLAQKNAFLYFEYHENPCMMNDNPRNAIDAKSNFHSYGCITLQIEVVVYQGPFFTYFDRY